MDKLTINRTTDLAALAPGLKQHGRYYTGPCPFCGGDDRFNIKRTDEGDLWICRQCGDGKYHDVVAFRMRAEGKTFREVVGETRGEIRDARLEIRDTGYERQDAKATPFGSHLAAPAHDFASPPDEDWQIARLVDQKQAADRLWLTDVDPETMAGVPEQKLKAVWRYLRAGRGLTPDIIRNYMLGYNHWGRTLEGGASYPAGLHIPCMVDGQLWYVKVRLSKAAIEEARRTGKRPPKYMMLRGSRAALFNADRLPGARGAVVVEGEFDALLLGRFLPAGWAAVTMGGASLLPDEVFLPYFSNLDRVLLCLDADPAGQAALAAWRGLLGRVEVAPPLPGGAKDFTEFWRMKGDIDEWLARCMKASTQGQDNAAERPRHRPWR